MYCINLCALYGLVVDKLKIALDSAINVEAGNRARFNFGLRDKNQRREQDYIGLKAKPLAYSICQYNVKLRLFSR